MIVCGTGFVLVFGFVLFCGCNRCICIDVLFVTVNSLFDLHSLCCLLGDDDGGVDDGFNGDKYLLYTSYLTGM